MQQDNVRVVVKSKSLYLESQGSRHKTKLSQGKGGRCNNRESKKVTKKRKIVTCSSMSLVKTGIQSTGRAKTVAEWISKHKPTKLARS